MLNRLLLVRIAIVLGFGFAHAATAAVLPFQGALEIQISTLPIISFDAAGIADVGAGGASGVHLTGLVLPEAVVVASQRVLPVTDPTAAPIGGVNFTLSNEAGSFDVGPGGFLGGAMALRGVAKVCLFGPCSAPAANIEVPLSVVGEGGTVAVEGAVNVTVRGAPWTTAFVRLSRPFNTIVVGGVASGPGGATSSTAQPGGFLSAVTPIFISTNIGASSVIPAYGRILMRFATEPPQCDVATSASAYGVGDTIQFSTVRFRNPNPVATDVRIRLQLRIADVGAVSLLDSPVTMGPGFDTDIGPVDAFVVQAGQPSGTYLLHCTVEEPGGTPLFADEAPFEVNAAAN